MMAHRSGNCRAIDKDNQIKPIKIKFNDSNAVKSSLDSRKQQIRLDNNVELPKLASHVQH